MRIVKGTRRLSIADLAVWLAVGVLVGAVGLASAFTEPAYPLGFNWTDFGIGVAALVLVLIGLLFRWGPMVPCTILGIAVAAVMSPALSSSYEEAVYNDLGVPTIGAICGAIIGVLWEMYRRR